MTDYVLGTVATMAEVVTMRKMLGADSDHPGYRNRFVCNEGDEPLAGMERKGLVCRDPNPHSRQVCYRVTAAWCEALGIAVQP